MKDDKDTEELVRFHHLTWIALRGAPVLWLCVFGIASMGIVYADFELPKTPPPQPLEQTVEVEAGGVVDINLQAVSRFGGQLRFIIRSLPELGALSEPTTDSLRTATVRYTHDPLRTGGFDEFTYAVQAPGTGVSTPAKVVIRVIEQKPIFFAPGKITFPPTPVGETSIAFLELSNNGGGSVAGKVELPEPFSFVSSDGSYSLGPGESVRLSVQFAPVRSDQYEYTARYNHDPALSTGLSASAFDPIETAPRRIDLHPQGTSNERVGRMTVRNLTSTDRAVEIFAPPELVVQRIVELPGNEEREVTIATREDFLGALDGVIRVTGDSTELNVPVRVAAAPARLVLENVEGGIRFGTLKTGETAKKVISIGNAGGSSALVSVRLPRGTSVDPDPSTQPLEPGEHRTIEISFFRTVPQEVRDQLVFEMDGRENRIPIEATIESAYKPGPPSTSDQLREIQKSGVSSVQFTGIPAIEEVGVTRRTRHELDLVWTAPSDRVADYAVYRRHFEFDSEGELDVRWEPMPNAKVRVETDQGRLFLRDLKPGEQVALSIYAVDAAGGKAPPSLPFLLTTEPTPPLRIPWGWILSILFIASVAVLVRGRIRFSRDEP